METLTQTRTRTFSKRALSAEVKQRFIAYFMMKYPATKKIKVGLNPNCAYQARVHYKDERPRTFRVWAYEYETLILKLHEMYQFRGVPCVSNR